MSRADSEHPRASSTRLVACVLLALAGAALALGTLFDLWVGTLSFGGPDGVGRVTGAHIVGHVLLVIAGVGVPIAVTRLLLGRIPTVALSLAGATAILLALAVLGLSR